MAKRWIITLAMLLVANPLAAQSSGSPDGALEELLTTDNPQVLLRHLPQEVQEQVQSLPAPLRDKLLRGYVELIAAHRGAGLRAASGNSWQVVDKSGLPLYTVRLENSFISGTEAMLRVSARSDSWSRNFLVEMRLEDSDWRFIRFGESEFTDWGIAHALRQLSPAGRNEDAVASLLRELAYRLYRFRHYSAQGGDAGYPDRLATLAEYARRQQEEAEREAASQPYEDSQALTGGPDDEDISLAAASAASPSQAPADPDGWMERDPIVNSGYVFHYTVTDSGRAGQPGDFEITASPLDYGKTGTQSFFIDSTCVLRATSQNREARRDDPQAPMDDFGRRE